MKTTEIKGIPEDKIRAYNLICIRHKKVLYIQFKVT
jgi:hypothetical protein